MAKCVPLSTFLCITYNILLISACFSKHFEWDCLYWLNLLILEVVGKMICWVLGMSLRLLLLEMENFPQININFWTNIYIFWTIWCRNFYQLRWRSVIWIQIERNVFDHSSSVNCFHTRTLYWLHLGCGIWMSYDFIFYFWYFRNFPWHFRWLSNSFINGRKPPSPHSCSSLTYVWLLLQNFIIF